MKKKTIVLIILHIIALFIFISMVFFVDAERNMLKQQYNSYAEDIEECFDAFYTCTVDLTEGKTISFEEFSEKYSDWERILNKWDRQFFVYAEREKIPDIGTLTVETSTMLDISNGMHDVYLNLAGKYYLRDNQNRKPRSEKEILKSMDELRDKVQYVCGEISPNGDRDE